MTRFIDELHLVGTLTDPHLDEYDGTDYVTPSLIDHDDGKENNGEESPRRGNAALRVPATEA